MIEVLLKLFRNRLIKLALCVLPLSGCVTYLTPGAGAPMQTMEAVADVAQRPQPQAAFPARIAVVRLQAPGYRSFGADGVTAGSYSVVMTREVETAGEFDAMGQWPQVLGVEPLSRLLLPVSMQSFADLRSAAAGANTDILFAYTFDTQFHVENHTYQPEELITLGVLPGREASVSSTVAGAFIDVRSGYVYGTAEGSGVTRTSMTKWTKPAAADEPRLQAARSAFAAMMEDARHKWAAVVAQYGQAAMTAPDPDAPIAATSPESASVPMP